MARRDMVGDKGEKSPGSLNCADVIGLFPEYFSGRLSPFQSVLFEEHRAACASCRSELAIRARETMRSRLNAVPARRGQTIAVVGARLRQALFQPARVKVPLEAAGLLIAVGLAFYLSQRSSTHPERSAADPAPKAALRNADSARSQSATTVEAKPEPDNPVKPQAKAAPAPLRAQQSPRTAAPQRAVPQEPADTQPTDERLASAEGTDNGDENNLRESAVPDVPADFSGNDKTGGGDAGGVTGDSRISPDDLPYFFLYNPSMKPL